jgi:hypothetical protein
MEHVCTIQVNTPYKYTVSIFLFFRCFKKLKKKNFNLRSGGWNQGPLDTAAT